MMTIYISLADKLHRNYGIDSTMKVIKEISLSFENCVMNQKYKMNAFGYLSLRQNLTTDTPSCINRIRIGIIAYGCHKAYCVLLETYKMKVGKSDYSLKTVTTTCTTTCEDLFESYSE